jgi:elongation factor Ts
MQIKAQDVHALRAKTGAGIMDCKRALAAENGDMEKAVDYLRKKGLSASAKKEDRIASEGVVGSYIHAGGKIGVMVEVNCETDFVGRNEDFQGFVRDVAMHVAAINPRFVRRDEVPADEVERERQVLLDQIRQAGKPEAVAEKMLEGRLGKFFAESCLMEQPFVKQPDKTVDQVQSELVSKIGERVVVRRFVRFALGEGMEKRSEDFASEVQKAAAGG